VALDQTGAVDGFHVLARHEWWRLLTACFVHIGIFHLFINMLSLWFIGPKLEQMLGSLRFLFFYLLAGIVGSCGALIGNPAGAAGASGAIWGVMTGMAVLIFAYRRILPPQLYRPWLQQLITIILVNTFITMSVTGISRGGHFGGGIAGALLVVPIDYLRRGRGIQKVVAAAVIVAVPIVGVMWASHSLERASPDKVHGRANLARFLHDYKAKIKETTKEAENYYLGLRRRCLYVDPDERKPDEVKEAYAELAAQKRKLAELKEQLEGDREFQSPAVQEAQAIGIQLIAAHIDLLDQAEDCLRKKWTREEAQEKLPPFEIRVSTAKTEWKSLW
jgi:membrane associated rhomboid family serine protease